MLFARNFTISPSSQIGDVYGTEFTFTANLPGEFTSLVWDFGDKRMSYNKNAVTHTYDYPGIYTIGLSAWTDYGKIYVDEATVDVDYVHRDALEFARHPELFNLPGFTNYDPFVLSVTSSKIDQPIAIYMQVFGTKSFPYYATPSKWRFLTPTWSIMDASTSAVSVNNLLQVPTEPIYKNNKVVAVKGQASFFYTDSFPSDPDPIQTCPLLIGATLSTQHFTYPRESIIYPYNSYANTEACRAVMAWQITNDVPTTLIVTENFINDVYPIKWTNVQIPIMLTLESDPGLLESFVDETTVNTTCLGYPSNNLFGSQYPVVLTLSSNKSLIGSRSEFTYGVHFSAERDRYFQTYDEYGNNIAGYVFTSITPFQSILTAVGPDSTFVVLASTIVTNTTGGDVDEFMFPYGYPIRSNVYVAHPELNVINKIAVSSYPKYCQTVAYYQENELLPEGAQFSWINVPALTTTDIKQLTLSGANGMYGMAFNPIRNRFYATDADQNSLVMYDSFNVALTTIQLSSIFNSEILAPAHLSIDRKFNIWVSLFDDHRLAKFDYKLKYLLSAAPTIVTGTKTLASPPVVETDRKNRVWACWSHPVSSLLVKFDQYGNELYKASPFPGNSEPVSIAIDPQNWVWVACKQLDSIRRYTSEGSLDRNVPLFIRPSYISLDRRAKVWVAHGYNLCSKYDPKTHSLSTWKFHTYYDENTTTLKISSEQITDYQNEDWEKGYKEDEIWGGLSTDVYNRVWIIDSVNNVFGVFNTDDPFTIVTVLATPTVPLRNRVILPKTTYQSEVSAMSDMFPIAGNIRSAQAGGDWTGNRWYQKYAGVYVTLPVYGQSAPFKLYDLDSSFEIPKINETFDCAAYFKDLALPEVLSNNTKLFDEFFAAVVGDSNPSKESAGRVVYERIANFINNHGDFETAEIDQLKSIAESMAVDVKTFGDEFPVAINRLLSLFSVPKQRLRGIPALNTDVEENTGRLLVDTTLGTETLFTTMLTANRYYLLKDKKYNESQLIYVTNLLSGANTINSNLNIPSEGLSVFPAYYLDVPGLRGSSDVISVNSHAFYDNYYLYEYFPENSKGYTDNLIDWDSEFNTVSYTLSTNEEWYGDGGLVETMFNKLLTKQLFKE